MSVRYFNTSEIGNAIYIINSAIQNEQLTLKAINKVFLPFTVEELEVVKFVDVMEKQEQDKKKKEDRIVELKKQVTNALEEIEAISLNVGENHFFHGNGKDKNIYTELNEQHQNKLKVDESI